MAEFFNRALHRFDCRARQRLGHIADPTADQFLGRFRISVTKFLHSPRDLGKKISRLKLEIIFV